MLNPIVANAGFSTCLMVIGIVGPLHRFHRQQRKAGLAGHSCTGFAFQKKLKISVILEY
jgi:hypothetical protein